jgi:hypothetical protein
MLALAAIAAAPVALLAGCGEDNSLPETQISSSSVTEGEPVSVTRDEFIVFGDDICAEVNAAVGALESTETDTATAAGQRADLYQGMLERIQALGDPTDDATGLDDFLAAGDELVQAESDVQLAAQRGQEDAVAEAEAAETSALATFQAEADSFGFDECGAGPTDLSTIGPDGVVPTEPIGTEPVEPVEPVTPVEPVPTEPVPEPVDPGGGTEPGTTPVEPTTPVGPGDTGDTGGVGPG